MTKVISICGECEEDEDPQVAVKAIMDGFEQLNNTGYRDLAISTLDEAALALKLSGYLCGVKSAHRAKKDGDWDFLEKSINACTTYNELLQWGLDTRRRREVMPVEWRPHIQELYDRKKEALKGNSNDEH